MQSVRQGFAIRYWLDMEDRAPDPEVKELARKERWRWESGYYV